MVRERLRALLRTLARSWPGRFLLAGALAKVLLLPFVTDGGSLLAWVDVSASLALAVGLGHLLLQSVARLRRRLLWRVRRKLILSYVFIGFVPVLLVAAFFAVAGAMSVLSASAETVRREIDGVIADVRVAAAGIGARLSSGMEVSAALEPLESGLQGKYPGASALVLRPVAAGGPVLAGPWSGGPRPDGIPEWVDERGLAGLVTVGSRWPLSVRAVAWVGRADARAVVIDVPLDRHVQERIATATGVDIDSFASLPGDDSLDPARLASADGLAWVVFLDPLDWATGAEESGNLFIRVPAAAFSEQFFGAGVGDEASVRYFFLVLLAAIGGLFLVIELAAFVTGLALARSITGSIHALSTGTDRIRRGDFTQRISVTSGDQLGDLAESFNAMTASVEGLLHQAAEKKRLENELRLARQIQMSLLPRDPTSVPGLSVTAVCRPAREIGGDYYDFIRLGERRLGVLVADVSGKGTSAALYMAELKGLVLSLGHTYESPRQLLIEANRILAGALDSRSFITMLYAVIDLDAGTLTYARAGHTPLIHASGEGGRRKVRVLIPDGLMLGLHGLERQFTELLEEHQMPVEPGDVAVLFTDGVTEAMNEQDDLFGEARLARLLADEAADSSDALHERILRDVDAFVGSAAQHDDMTMVLLRIDEVRRRERRAEPAGAAVEAGAGA
jgi:sigma-B regulation protein RsbU (phosphoserine phosphatase)